MQRPVFRVRRADPQLALFVAVDPIAPSTERLTTIRNGFVEVDPTSIRICDRPLREHLEEAGVKLPLAIRELLLSLDWTPFEATYAKLGRPPYAPRTMVGLIVYAFLEGLDSLRDLEKFARTNLGCMWITGGIAPDHSCIADFMNRHAVRLQSDFFETLTRRILRTTGGNCDSVSGDATVIQAAASRHRRLTAEAARVAAAKARREAESQPDDEALARRAAETQVVAAVAEERSEAREKQGKDPSSVLVSPTEPSAVNQPQKDKSIKPSYKPSILANEQGLIVAVEVQPSSETAAVRPMVAQAERIAEEPVKTIKLDAGYFANEVIEFALEKDLDLLCPEGRDRGEKGCAKRSEKRTPKSTFTYDEAADHYVCPAGEHLRPIDRCKATGGRQSYVRYGTPACASCPLRATCTKSKKGRRIKRYAGDDAKDSLRAVMAQPAARAAFRRRSAEVEPVFARLRSVQRFNRFRRRGLAKVTFEFALHAIAHNIARAIALIEAGASVGATVSSRIRPFLAAFAAHALALALVTQEKLIPVRQKVLCYKSSLT